MQYVKISSSLADDLDSSLINCASLQFTKRSLYKKIIATTDRELNVTAFNLSFKTLIESGTFKNLGNSFYRCRI